MTLAAEAELGALFLNAKEAAYLQQILTKMGHPQPQTPIQTNNLRVEGVINHKIQPKPTEAIDMHFHWLCDSEAQGQFWIYWWPGKNNLANYFTKHHAPLHHVNVRSEFLSKVKDLAEARRSETGTRTDHTQISNKLISYKGVLDLPNMYVRREATYLAKQAVGN